MDNNRNSSEHKISVRNGEVFIVKRLLSEDSVIRNARPVIIFQNDIACIRSSNATIIPVSSKQASQVTHIIIPGDRETGLEYESIAECESITTISKNMLSHRLGFLNRKLMMKVSYGVSIHLSLISPVNKSYINQLCEQISKNINYLGQVDKVDKTDVSSKLALNSMRINVMSLKIYCNMYQVNWTCMLLNSLKNNKINYKLEEIARIFDLDIFNE